MLLTFEMSEVGEGQDEATFGGAWVLGREDPGPAADEYSDVCDSGRPG